MTLEQSPRGLADMILEKRWPEKDLLWCNGFVEPYKEKWRVIYLDEMESIVYDALEWHAFGQEDPQWPTRALVDEVITALRTLEAVFIPQHIGLPKREVAQ